MPTEQRFECVPRGVCLGSVLPRSAVGGGLSSSSGACGWDGVPPDISVSTHAYLLGWPGLVSCDQGCVEAPVSSRHAVWSGGAFQRGFRCTLAKAVMSTLHLGLLKEKAEAEHPK